MSSRGKSPARGASTSGAASSEDNAAMNYFKKCISDSFKEGSLFEKFSLIVTMFWNMPLFILIMPLLTKLGIRKPRDEIPNTPLQLVAPFCWQTSYWAGQANATIIQGVDRSLMVVLPPPPQQRTLDELAKLGPVKVIVLTRGHDTYAAAWAKLFPEATVLAPQDQVAGSHVEINGTLADSADLLRKYHVVEAIDTSRFHRSNDCCLILDIAGNKVALMECGVGNQSLQIFNPLSWYLYIAGFVGLRAFRQFSLVFCTDVYRWQKHIVDVANIDNLQIVLFQHGKPLRNVDLLADVVVSRSPFYFPWPFAR